MGAMGSEAFPNDALDAIATDGQFDVFLGNDQPNAGMGELIGTSKDKEVLIRYPEFSPFEDMPVIARRQ